MPRTAFSLRTEPAARLVDLERRRPEWKTWLNLLREAQAAVASWQPATTGDMRFATSNAPLLHGRTLEIDAGRVRRLLHTLASIAAGGDLAGSATLHGYRPSKGDAVGLLLAAVRQDKDELAALADNAGVDRGALASIAHLAALPLLQSWGALLQEQVPSYWPQGYCPICAAWPILAERRGLDRTRRMRCGRCGGEWEMEWLCCAYCGERDHNKLGSLVLDESGEVLKVETCATCRGYLKSVATLQSIPPFELLLRDLETVELDLVAIDHGYARPEECGFALDVQLGAA
jgi:FdhE protein